MSHIYQGEVTAVEICQGKNKPVDQLHVPSYVNRISLLFVSTAGRGAASSEAALAFFTGRMDQEVAA
jgi:hypothetical protein